MNKIVKILFTAVIYFVVWILLTASLKIEEIFVGIIVSLGIALFTFENFTSKGLRYFSPKRLLYIIRYIPFFLWEVIKANFDVAYRVIHPKMPIKPGIVEVKTSLKTDTGKFLLANSITLTPGTLTIDVVGDRLFIHWIYVKTKDIEKATKMIPAHFEWALKEIE